MPLVSIIIPTYNREHLIGETLNSVLAQTYTNWECLVIDDGSADNTSSLLETYCKKDSRIQYHHRPKNQPGGGNAARNYGFELSKGEYINWFDSDDIMLHEFIEKKINLISSKKLKAIICSGYLTDSQLNILRPTKYFNDGNLFKEFTLRKSDILTPSILFRKSALNSTELFNIGLTDGQETEFFHRFFFDLKNDEYKYIDEKLFLYRKHSNSIGSNKIGDYNFKNRFSQAYVEFENLKRIIKIGDREMINFVYKALLNLLFLTMDNKDNHTYNYILDGIRGYYKDIGVFNYMVLICYLKVVLNINMRSYRIEKMIRRR